MRQWGYDATLGPASTSDPRATSTPRSFGLTVGSVLALIGLAPMRHGLPVRPVVLGIAFVLVSLALAAPALLAVPNRAWTMLGDVMHRIVSPLVLGVVYFLVVTPIAVIQRIRGTDVLGLRLDPKRETYWLDRDGERGDLRQQF